MRGGADLLQQPVAEVVGLAGERPVEILHQDGHAAERAVDRVGCLVACAVESFVDHCVDRGVQVLDPRDRGVDELQS
jgi:hypothetical protein